MPSLNARVFLFDFDGVIVDSESLHMQAALETSHPHGITFSKKYYYDILLGFDDVGLFKRLWSDHKKKLDEKSLTKLLQQKNKIFRQIIAKKLVFFDGVMDFINRLKKLGIPLAIVSGALFNEIEACLIQGKILDDFKFIISADRVTHSKPHPESYATAFNKMRQELPGLKKSECWVIEDSPTGITSAKVAGLPVIGITNSRHRDDLKNADLIIAHYTEIKLNQPS